MKVPSYVKLVLALGLATALWVFYDYMRQRKCDREGQAIELAFDYDDRLTLRAITTAPGLPAGAPNWGDVSLRLESYMRDWSKLRAHACMENRGELEECLESQKTHFSDLIEAWNAGDLSWVANDLDELLPSVTTCLGPRR